MKNIDINIEAANVIDNNETNRNLNSINISINQSKDNVSEKKKAYEHYILMKEIKIMIHIQKLVDMMMPFKLWIKCVYMPKFQR